jgi:hypothetical protein
MVKNKSRLGTVVYMYNLRYLSGGTEENCGSRPAQGKLIGPLFNK